MSGGNGFNAGKFYKSVYAMYTNHGGIEDINSYRESFKLINETYC